MEITKVVANLKTLKRNAAPMLFEEENGRQKRRAKAEAANE
jgi:hypothetical protein